MSDEFVSDVDALVIPQTCSAGDSENDATQSYVEYLPPLPWLLLAVLVHVRTSGAPPPAVTIFSISESNWSFVPSS